MKLRMGGFTIPFLKRMKQYFEYVAKVTRTASTVPLSMTIRSWAIYWLIECPKGVLIFILFWCSLVEHEFDKNIPFLKKQSTSSSAGDSSKTRGHHAKSKKMEKGKQPASSTSKPNTTQSLPSLPSSTSSTDTPSSTSNDPHPTVQVTALNFLKEDGSSILIWKGVSPVDRDRFQMYRMKWSLLMCHKLGDLSATPAIYYTNSRRYAIAWGAYRIPPASWQKETINGAIVFEAELLPLLNNISTANLPNTSEVQQV